jgi:hypothetical protein
MTGWLLCALRRAPSQPAELHHGVTGNEATRKRVTMTANRGGPARERRPAAIRARSVPPNIPADSQLMAFGAHSTPIALLCRCRRCASRRQPQTESIRPALRADRAPSLECCARRRSCAQLVEGALLWLPAAGGPDLLDKTTRPASVDQRLPLEMHPRLCQGRRRYRSTG